MGRQVNFFLHTKDQPNFDTLLKSWDNLVLLSYKSFNGELSILQDSILKSGQDLRVCLARQEDLKDIKLEYITTKKYWLVDSLRCPVIEFDRCYCTDSTIGRGRLYFQPKYVADMQWVEKPHDFVVWADNIIKTVRKKLKKYKHQMGPFTYTEYLGENASLWLRENDAEVQSAGAVLAVDKK